MTTLKEISLDTLDGFSKLPQEKQQTVIQAHGKIFESLHIESESRIETGKNLKIVRDELEPLKLWKPYYTKLRISRSTVYNYIGMYEAASKKMPLNILEAAVRMGVSSINFKTVKSSSPPKTDDPEVIDQYVKKIEKRYTRKSVKEIDAEWELKMLLHRVGTVFEGLEGYARVRQRWIERFMGMCMTRFGLSGDRSFSATAIPESFTVHRGRPITIKNAA